MTDEAYPPRPFVADELEHAQPLVVPALPSPEPPRPFPLLATLAPVAGSLAIWSITSSPFALIFAALGPLIAVASVGDQVVGGRRRSRKASRVFLRDLAHFEARVQVRHDAERAGLDRRYPDLGAPESMIPSPARPGAARLAAPPVRVGRGTVRSWLQLDGVGPASVHDPTPTALAAARTGALSAAARLDDAPIVVDVAGGLGLCGARSPVLPVARAVALQLARSLDPATTTITVPDSAAWRWMLGLPHRVGVDFVSSPVPDAGPDGAARHGTGAARHGGGAVERVVFDLGGGGSMFLAIATTREALPPGCSAMLLVDAACARLTPAPGGAEVALRADLLSEQDALRLVDRLRADAESSAGAHRPCIPDSVALADVLECTASSGQSPDGGEMVPAGVVAVNARVLAGPAGTLAAPVGRDARGPVIVDLVRDGPHAVVGGTTGSGKSELLLTWILALAARYPPSTVNFLLVDFKGGATMDALARLPHTVGVVTDLDRGGAARAVASLAAELRRREQVLAESGLRSVEALPSSETLARLVIVVDEFAALLAETPDLAAVFADLAARGRSLGIHLLLCTQRPSGVVREAVLANCALRISLRVASTADSLALFSTAAAAGLPKTPVGRAVVSRAGDDPEEFQVAIAGGDDYTTIEGRWPAVDLHRPWCPPLPELVEPADLVERGHRAGAIHPFEDGGRAPGIAFALADLPEQQRQTPETWDPMREGSLLVVGRAGSGRSSALRALSTAAESKGWASLAIPSDPAGAWDALAAAAVEATDADADADASADPLESGISPRTLVVIDDVDALLARFGDDHRAAFEESLVRLVRDGPAQGIHLVASARRITPAMHQFASVCDSRVLLALPSRHEHVLHGGLSARFVDALPAGGGHRDGRRLQI
ncbi:MAG: hypothetical protein RI885_2321, partial [Actinomycetota bacterium]